MIRNLLQLALIFFVGSSALRADDITLTDGTVLKNAKIVQRDDSTKTVTISFSGGITQVHSEMLPPTPAPATSSAKPNAAGSAVSASEPAVVSSPTIPSLQKSASDYNAEGFDKFTKGDFDGAITDLDQAIALDPKLAEAYNRRGNANRAKGNKTAAVADYQQAITIDPTYANPHNNLGTFKVEKGDFDGAISDFDKAIALDPKLPQAYLNRGIAKRDKGFLDDAISDFKQATALDPKLTPQPPSDYDPAQEEQSFVNSVQKLDPSASGVISSFHLKGDTMAMTVTDKFNTTPYEVRLQLAGAMYKFWAKFHDAKSETWVSPITMEDSAGVQVAGMNATGVWVKPQSDQDAQNAQSQREANFVKDIKKSQVRVGGQIVQIIASDSALLLDPGDGKLIYVSNVNAGNFVDGDRVSVMAVPNGPTTYTTVLGAQATVRSYYVLPKD